MQRCSDCIDGDRVSNLSNISFDTRIGAVHECLSLEAVSRFIRARDSLPARLQCFVIPYTRKEYIEQEARLFLTEDGRGGFGMIGQDLSSLFSLPGARHGDLLVAAAVKLGASRLTCYDTNGKLVALYSRHGFLESLRVPWDDSLAPVNWDYEAWGRPDCVEMRLDLFDSQCRPTLNSTPTFWQAAQLEALDHTIPTPCTAHAAEP